MKEPTSGSRMDTGTCVPYRQILVLIEKKFFFSFFAWVCVKWIGFFYWKQGFYLGSFVSVNCLVPLSGRGLKIGLIWCCREKSVTCIYDWGWFNWTVKPLQVRDCHTWHMCICFFFVFFLSKCVSIPASIIAKCESVSHSVVSDSLQPLWTGARQAPLSMGFPRHEYWSRLPFPPSGDLPDQAMVLLSTCIAGRFFIIGPLGKPTFFSGNESYNGPLFSSCRAGDQQYVPATVTGPGVQLWGVMVPPFVESRVLLQTWSRDWQ